jgi:hypothetical protein
MYLFLLSFLLPLIPIYLFVFETGSHYVAQAGLDLEICHCFLALLAVERLSG